MNAVAKFLRKIVCANGSDYEKETAVAVQFIRQEKLEQHI